MPLDEAGASRRRVAAGVAGAAAAALAGTASAQTHGTNQAAAPTSGAASLENPVTEYPKRPFKKQEQPWPGLASKMTPPDR